MCAQKGTGARGPPRPLCRALAPLRACCATHRSAAAPARAAAAGLLLRGAACWAHFTPVQLHLCIAAVRQEAETALITPAICFFLHPSAAQFHPIFTGSMRLYRSGAVGTRAARGAASRGPRTLPAPPRAFNGLPVDAKSLVGLDAAPEVDLNNLRRVEVRRRGAAQVAC